mmetsp:Transcript_33937/g.106381  ORF Transcript_33937/g.106381 Transcript_33937/m.106381 type:complete len:288 (+) Transcript_33937:163-1026(+)
MDLLSSILAADDEIFCRMKPSLTTFAGLSLAGNLIFFPLTFFSSLTFFFRCSCSSRMMASRTSKERASLEDLGSLSSFFFGFFFCSLIFSSFSLLRNFFCSSIAFLPACSAFRTSRRACCAAPLLTSSGASSESSSTSCCCCCCMTCCSTSPLGVAFVLLLLEGSASSPASFLTLLLLLSCPAFTLELFCCVFGSLALPFELSFPSGSFAPSAFPSCVLLSCSILVLDRFIFRPKAEEDFSTISCFPSLGATLDVRARVPTDCSRCSTSFPSSFCDLNPLRPVCILS